MALVKCDECGKEISDEAISCPKCGVPVYEESQVLTVKGGFKFGLGFSLAMMILPLVAMIVIGMVAVPALMDMFQKFSPYF